MSISCFHSKGADLPIAILAIGLDLIVHMAPTASGGAFSIIETINALGKGPPRHKHAEAEIFASSRAASSTRRLTVVASTRRRAT